MTRAGRALLGAAIGAAITLLFHPISRPYPFSAFITPSGRHNAAPAGTLTAVSEWMLAVGDRYIGRKPLTRTETGNAIDAAERAVKLDPDNAYWHQMLAGLYHALGNESEARRQWSAASACAQWNDYQGLTLLGSRNSLARDFGAPQSWQMAYAYYQRNENAVQFIMSYSRSILVTSPLATSEGLLIRARSVLNGARIQQQGRSIRIGRLGGTMMEAACHPPDVVTAGSYRKLTLARMDMYNRLRQMGQNDLADAVNKAYRDSDAWNAYESPDDAAEQVAELSLASLFYVGFPTMMLVVGVLGVAIWILGRLLRKLDHVQIVPAAIAGMALAIAAYASTLLPLAAATTFLCCVFLTLGPRRERKLRIDDLGPMFAFSVFTLGVVFMLLLGCFVVGASAPAAAILPEVGVPHEYFGGAGVLLGLAIIVLAMLVLLAPLFAVALRVGTSFVLSMALRKFGAFLGFFSLVGIVVGTPLCIYLDRENSRSLERIVTNEPVYYLSLQR